MGNINDMKTMADALWSYFQDKYLIPYLSDSVCYFQASVTTAPDGNVIGVQRPFDNEMTLPYAWSAAQLEVGNQCTVLVFGDMNNAIVIGDGTLSLPGSVPVPYNSNPAMDSVASPGTSAQYARGNHVHPTDTSRASSVDLTNHINTTATNTTYGHVKLSDSTTSTSGQTAGVAATPAAVKAVKDAIPTVPSAYTSNPEMDGSASPGSSSSWSRGNHVHPTDTTRAPVASPNFTGTPTAPTAAAGTDTTQIATTAFVQSTVQTATAKYTDNFTTVSGWSIAPQSAYRYRTYLASTHGKGTTPSVDLYIKNGSAYEKYYGMPSDWIAISVDGSTGDVTLKANKVFAGRIIIT